MKRTGSDGQPFADVPGERLPVHAGHRDVGDERVEARRRGAQRFLAARRSRRRRARAEHELGRDAADELLVVDEQDPSRQRLRCRLRRRSGSGAGRLVHAGQPDRERAAAPGSLATVIVPPLCATMPSTVERPRPVPCDVFVVKKGSKMRQPRLLVHADAVVADDELGVCTVPSRTDDGDVCRRSGIASRAFKARLSSTCSSCGRIDRAIAPVREVVRAPRSFGGSRRASISSSPDRPWTRSTGSRRSICRRENASSWRVSFVARAADCVDHLDPRASRVVFVDLVEQQLARSRSPLS